MNAKTTNKSQGWKNILKFIIPYFVVVVLFQFLGMLLAGIDFKHFSQGTHQTSGQLFIIYFMSLIGTVGIVAIFRKYVDKKSFISLGFEKGLIAKDIITGLIIGFLIMLTGYTILIVSGQLKFVQIQINAADLILGAALFACVAITEEVMARGYLLNNLMVSFNKYVALIISAIIFSLMHFANPNANFSGLCIIFLAGILLGLPYIYSKKLWLPIALHFSWNFFQGTIFGFNVSGMEIYSLIQTKYETPTIWNGGKFGFEGSVLAIIFETLAIVGLYFLFRNRKPVELPSSEIATEAMESDELSADQIEVTA
jgi:membrane protease YdiL (CAAX protease family)